jgi:predicted amidohydrolase
MTSDILKVGLAQISPVWLDKSATMKKVAAYISEAGSRACDLVAFGEALAPGYPFWVEFTGGAKFNHDEQKSMYAHYVRNAIDIDAGDLDDLCHVAREHGIAVFLGTIERPQDRTSMSLYCSMVYIDKGGVVQSVHRKLMPTYEERLVWSPGDGHGLRTHALEGFNVGGLNCWENWMPLARASLYGQGENLHVAIWPGSVKNTQDITPFLAKEGRSFSMAVSGLMPVADIPKTFPLYDQLMQNIGDKTFLANGGSCLCAPNGDFIIEPQLDVEGLFTAEIDLDRVREERQNFDPAGHYSRPDVTCLTVNRERQSTVKFS